MANKKRSGLGRGLGSLIGESRVEIGQANDRESAFQESVQEDQKEQIEEPQKVPVSTTISEEAAVAATIKERPIKPAQAQQVNKPLNAAQTALKEAEMQANVAKPTPYIEEEDHATIKEVVMRDVAPADPIPQTDEVPIEKVVPNPNQPRTSFKEDEIEELATSIARDGLLQPILVRKVDDKYQIIAGERRWQASQRAGLKTIPIREKEADDNKVLELALIENIQRSDLNPIEEAYGYKRLMERNGMTQSEVAQVVSKGRSTIANALRLLDLPEEAQELLFDEKITAGHARAILSIPSMEGKQKLTDKLRNEKLSVRETEKLAHLYAGQAQNNENVKKRTPSPALYKKCARRLRKRFDTKVSVKTVRGKNKIEIEFTDEDDLQRIFDLIEQ